MTRIKNAATCSASTGAVAGDHEMREGAQHDAANADGMTLSQRLSCYGARHKGAAGSASAAGDSTEATRRTTGVVHGAVETVLEKMKTDHAASVVAINGQKLAKHDLTALMQALSLSWEKSTSSCGAQSCVRKLYLGQDEIGDEGASCIAESLKGPCQLSELRLHDNKIADAGAAALASSLQTNARISVLVLGHNQIKELGGASLGLMLRFNSAITDLDVSANDLGDHGVKLLAECLPSNKALRNLHLARNRVGALGVKGLCDALEHGCGLQRINLGSNPLGAPGAQVLAAALENEKVQLTHLHLGATNLGDAGAESLAKALAKNRWLTALYLQNNGIGDSGAHHIAKALGSNNSLGEVHMDGNMLTPVGVSSLAAAAAAKPLVSRPLPPPLVLAVGMSQHPRLGGSSPIGELTPKTLRRILQLCCTTANRKLRVSAAVPN